MTAIKASAIVNSITAVSEIYKGLLVFTNLEQQARLWAECFYDELHNKTQGLLTGSIDDFSVVVYNNRKGATLRFDHLQFCPSDGDSDDVRPATIVIEMVETATNYKNIRMRQLVCENMVLSYNNGRPQNIFSGKVMATDRDAIFKFITSKFSKV
ncbi:hypothetical protein [Yersinia ruckeri]|uniref:hypothetical protein n=1 Tax=Yersinia ruckeri TaxID=29486 RepID=UPI0022378604|nr:hypothetical protein [Yersinia ruckeri]MCW6598682.1 hypothetical protein [Yersinia ruckeri]